MGGKLGLWRNGGRGEISGAGTRLCGRGDTAHAESVQCDSRGQRPNSETWKWPSTGPGQEPKPEAVVTKECSAGQCCLEAELIPEKSSLQTEMTRPLVTLMKDVRV